MTCGGCENSVKTALEDVPGVIKVAKISYKDGVALVCFDPEKGKTDAMTTAVTNKGYEAEIIPAVARDDASVMHKTTGESQCTKSKSKTETKDGEGTH
jgi:copper chaperone